MTENQKAEFESHLKSCESCRKTFENEKALFDGIRLAGHQAMKLEIEHQVEKLKQERAGTDWTLIFKVAAVLFFLVIMPGTLYFLNTDLFTKKAEMVPAEEVDRMTGVKLEETEPVEDGAVLEDTEGETIESEIASSKEARMEKSTSISRAKSAKEKIKDEISVSKKTDDHKSLQDVLGNVEGTAPEKGVGGAGAIESVSKQVTPSTTPKLESARRVTATAKSKMNETDKKARSAPAVRAQMSKMKTDETVKEQNITTLSAEPEMDSEPEKTTVYELMPAEPIMLQENYTGNTDKVYTRKGGLNKLNFSSGYKKIIANVEPPAGTRDAKSEEIINTSFKVILLSKSPDMINMTWYPPFDVRPYEPDKISITQPDDSNLLIKFNQKYIYKVDISKDTTEAVLQK
ncbi:MAG: hypothetical protein P8100_13080 [bacterium]